MISLSSMPWHQSKRVAVQLTLWLASVLVAIPAMAQIYIEPSSPPPAGRSAAILDTSGTTQKKLGSLTIGQSPSPLQRLCLNGTGDLTGGDDATSVAPNGHCITSWSNVVNALGGPFVALVPTSPSSPGTLANYSQQSGYVRLLGGGSEDNAYTWLSQTNDPSAGTTTALYARSQLIEDMAGSFSGAVRIEPTAASLGRLCLNGTDNLSLASPGGHCIKDWSDIPGANINDQLTLQATTAPNTESGSVWLQAALNAGAVVLGAPPANQPAGVTTPYCGDGMCSQEISEDISSSSNYCALDCESILIPSLSAATISGGIRLTITPRAFSSGTQPYILVVRSVDQNFTFGPTDGVQFPAPSGDANFAIAYFQLRPNTNTFTYDDKTNGMQLGKKFYYRVYQGNGYPLFSKVALPGKNYGEPPTVPTSG